LKNTLVIVTSDNGMAMPRAAYNLYEVWHPHAASDFLAGARAARAHR